MASEYCIDETIVATIMNRKGNRITFLNFIRSIYTNAKYLIFFIYFVLQKHKQSVGDSFHLQISIRFT